MWLAHFRFLPGTDAYAYVLQARILAEQHRLQIHDAAYLVHAFDALIGTALGYERATALLIALAAFLPFASVSIVAPRNLAATLYALASPALFFCAVEFPRQALACALLPLWILAWRRRGAWLAVPLASAACHRMFIATALAFIAAVLVKGAAARAFPAAAVVVVAVVVVAVAAVAAVVVVHEIAARDDVAPRLLLTVPYLVLTLACALDVGSMRTGGAALVVLVAASTALRPLAHPDTHGNGRDLDEEARAVAALVREPPRGTLIARRKLAFLYTATTARDCHLFERNESGADLARFQRVVHGVSVAEVLTHLPERCPYGDDVAHRLGDTGYILVREDCYREMRAAWDDDILRNTAENPTRARPSFL